MASRMGTLPCRPQPEGQEGTQAPSHKAPETESTDGSRPSQGRGYQPAISKSALKGAGREGFRAGRRLGADTGKESLLTEAAQKHARPGSVVWARLWGSWALQPSLSTMFYRSQRFGYLLLLF